MVFEILRSREVFSLAINQVGVSTIPDLVYKEMQLVDDYKRHYYVISDDVQDRAVKEVLFHEDGLYLTKLHLVNDQPAQSLELLRKLDTFHIELVPLLLEAVEILDVET